MRVLVLHAAFNAPVVAGLVEGALAALAEMGVAEQDTELIEVPGAFELPVVAQAAARSRRWACIVALGVVAKGETDHYEHIAREASTGLAEVARETGVALGFGVLTVTRMQQAEERAAPGPGNKGGEAARAAVATARVLARLASRRKPAGKKSFVRSRLIERGVRRAVSRRRS